MKRIFGAFITTFLIFALFSGQSLAKKERIQKHKKEKQDFIIPCGHPVWRTLDFWVGEWQVFHKDSGKLAGYDRVIRTLKGCVIQQNWLSLDDHFSSPYVPFRMAGKSLTSFTGKEWVQFWTDNQGGTLILRGKFENKIFTLKNEKLTQGFRYRSRYFKEKNGTVRIIHDRKYEHAIPENSIDKKENASNYTKPINNEWHVISDLIYRKNNNQLLLPKDLKTSIN